MSDKHTPSRKSAIERREERRAKEGEAEFQVFIIHSVTLDVCNNLYLKVPKTIFERNVSPGLERKD